MPAATCRSFRPISKRCERRALTRRPCEMPNANHVLKTAPADLNGNRALYQNRDAPLDPDVMPRWRVRARGPSRNIFRFLDEAEADSGRARLQANH